MDTVIPAFILGCNLFLTIAAVIALLCFSRACLAYAKRSKVTVYAGGTTTSASAPSVLESPKFVTDPVTLLTKPAPEPEQSEEIECGACHKIISSEPISQIMDPANPSELYKCENCGAQVQVPA